MLSNFLNGILLSIRLISLGKADTSVYGTVFGAPINSHIVNTGCLHAGYPVCCSAFHLNNSVNTEAFSKDFTKLKARGKCIQSRVYVSSPYEINQYEKSIEIGKIKDMNERKDALLDFITSDREMSSSIRWLLRVKKHMTSHEHRHSHEKRHLDIDFQYLSYFNITETCADLIHSRSWIEWIEPLTVHARNPFSYGHILEEYNARVAKYNRENIKKELGLGSEIDILLGTNQYNTDYLLTQLGEHVHHYRLAEDGITIVPTKKYMFDAGTSRFDSSLWFFTCSYSQVSIEFDRLFGWEVTLLEPTDFWEKVPPRWKEKYDFYNFPISADITSKANPFHLMRSLGIVEDDFVAFKLDIDTPDIEVKIALELLDNPSFAGIVDEFFFELHFRCELMMKCCFGDPPELFHGLTLLRSNVLEFFRKLREKGVRSHFWV